MSAETGWVSARAGAGASADPGAGASAGTDAVADAGAVPDETVGTGVGWEADARTEPGAAGAVFLPHRAVIATSSSATAPSSLVERPNAWNEERTGVTCRQRMT
jgi:hypothetical protein